MHVMGCHYRSGRLIEKSKEQEAALKVARGKLQGDSSWHAGYQIYN